MTLKIYVASDDNGREWAPDTPHEVEACEWMLKKAWMEFNHLRELYAILVNIRHPTADLVVIRERGLGIMELKHVSGEIWIELNDSWKAGGTPIHSGIHLNPREQVRTYAKRIRPKVIDTIMPSYMRDAGNLWNEIKFQTGVCFTHPNVNLQRAQKYLNDHRFNYELWENFSVFDMKFSTTWIRELRFRLHHDAEHNFAPVRLDPLTIVQIATQTMSCVEWEEMQRAMPSGNPFGHLILQNGESAQTFNLVKDYSTIGRSHECDVVIPERFSRVSKKHCAIKRSLDGIHIVDLGSSNGTFLQSRPVNGTNPIRHGNTITLGGVSAGEKVCSLKFELAESASHHTDSTEIGTTGS